MKRIKKQIIILFIVVCFIFSGYAGASSIVLTAVNDEFLPLASETMPTKKSGEWYVPYDVFNRFGIASETKQDTQELVMQTSEQIITFSLSQGYTYDKNSNTLPQPAYYINNTIYLPVKLMCGQFKLSYSVISGENPIIRIYDSNAKLSDSDFINNKNESTDDIVDDYKEETNHYKPEPKPEKPESNEPEPIPDEQPVINVATRPSKVYITFVGKNNEYSNDLINTLNTYGINAVFFMPVDVDIDYNFARKAIANGNGLGFYIKGDETAEVINTVNEKLFNQTGIMTRLVVSQSGLISQELEANGYEVLGNTVKAQDNKYYARKTATEILDILSQTNSNCVLEFHHEKSTNAALTVVLRDLTANNVDITKITSAEDII